MIQIQNFTLDSTVEKQQIKLKGLQSVIGITKVASNIMATIIVNTSSDLLRTAPVYLIKTGEDAMSLLLKPKYIGSVGKYNLFIGEISPRR